MSLHQLPPDFEVDHLDAFLAWVGDFSLAVDGGAHTGAWTRVMAKRFDVVHAFEPVPENVERIPLRPNVTVYQRALSDRSGPLWFVPGMENEGQWHVAEHGANGMTAEAVRLDDLSLPSCGLLKLDVEGCELRALRGAEATIATFRPVIVVEENGLCERYGENRAEMGAWLRARDYDRVLRLNKDECWVSRSARQAAA